MTLDRIELSANDLDVAARTVDGEAGDQGADGMAAVAWVIRNRVEWMPQAWWGHSVPTVCLHPSQYTCWSGGPDTQRIKAMQISSLEYLKACDIVLAVMDGDLPDPTGGATTYKVKGTAAMWDHAVENIPAREIGKHQFWRLAPNGVCYEPQGIGGTDNVGHSLNSPST